MQPDLFNHVEPSKPARAEPSKVIAAQRRRAKADRLRKPRPFIEPVRGEDGSVVAFAGGIHRPTFADEWAALVIEYPEAMATVMRAALEHVAQARRPSIDAVWQDIRGKVPPPVSDNNMRAPCARWLMATVPALAGRFKTRTNAGQQPERAR